MTQYEMVGIVLSGADRLLVRILTWMFTGYFTLNVLMNLFLSQKSSGESDHDAGLPATCDLFRLGVTILM